MDAGAFAVSSMTTNTIVNLAVLLLCIQQTFMYSARNDAGEFFFDNFSLVAKSVSCFKMFVTAYHAVQTKGSEMFALIEEDGGNQNSLRGLQVTVAEMLIAIYQFVDHVGNAHSPWVAEKILHLVGSGLPVLIGACHVSWIAYKAGIISKVVEWLRKIARALAGEEEQVAGGAAPVGGGDGDAEVGEEGVGIVVVVLA
ncbi:hypothetical protein ZWY2020_000731 [Hordeum vulgare]|nr:hypothetical protein ZWY2020_000714 [Hordeum vulgare]KAI4969817.1 hypothetical protein ZWY2020_000731 [Hordeum vulgare]